MILRKRPWQEVDMTRWKWRSLGLRTRRRLAAPSPDNVTYGASFVRLAGSTAGSQILQRRMAPEWRLAL